MTPRFEVEVFAVVDAPARACPADYCYAAGTCAEIARRVAAGDLWAWCRVTVVAQLRRAATGHVPGAVLLEGHDALRSPASYTDAREFVTCGDEVVLRAGALARLKRRAYAVLFLLLPDADELREALACVRAAGDAPQRKEMAA